MVETKQNNPGTEGDKSTDMVERLRTIILQNKIEKRQPRRLHIILNPAAGRDEPILKTLNVALQTAEVDWEVFVTKKAGDAMRYAQNAAREGVDVVAVYGGDGTVMEVASGLVGTEIPIAIIPGGTANVMAVEVGILGDLVESCALAVHPSPLIRKVDMGKIDDRYFLLRVGMGLEAAMVEGADREKKDRLGVLAYALSALQALTDPPMAKYRLTMDGNTVEVEGVTCIVANSGSIGMRAGMTLAPNISVSDGLLDVIVLRRADLGGLFSVAASVVGGQENRQDLPSWQARQVTVEADPPQTVQADGEVLGETPVTIQVVPEAVRIIVPPGREVE